MIVKKQKYVFFCMFFFMFLFFLQYGKKDLSKNLNRYRSENNFVESSK